MSQDKISLEFLAARVGGLTDRMRDLELRMRSLEVDMREMKTRFTALEARFSALKERFSIQEERMAECWRSWCAWLSAKACRQMAGHNEALDRWA